MTNILPGMGGGGATTSTGPGGTTVSANTQPDLTSLVTDFTGSGASSPLTGGTDTGLISSAAFDPALFSPGGLFSPTGQPAVASTPGAREAQQDPSGQIPPDQTQAQTPTPAAPTEQQQQQATPPAQTQTETPPDQTPAGPTGLGGDQQAGGRGGQGGLRGLVSQLLGGPTGPLGKASRALAGRPQQQPAAVPPDGGTQPGAAPPAAPPAAEPAGGRVPAPSQPVPGAQPTAATGAAPAGGSPLLNLIHNIARALGGQPPDRGPQSPLAGVAQQAYPQRQFNPVSPTAGLGPYARARMHGQPGKYEQPSQDEWTRNVSSGGAIGQPPGSTDEVTAPTDQQARQGRLAGTDTPPTAGFSPVLERERAKFRNELSSNPRTRWETLAMIALEQGGDPAAVAESLLNRSDYAKTSVHNMLHSGFYGPINFGKLGREIRRLQSDPQRAAKLNAGLETALRGSNLLGGATDQGSGSDPNVGHRGGRVIRFGEIYNDWGGGPGGHNGAANYRRAQQQRVRAGQQAAERGQQFAMDIGRTSPFPVPGAEAGPMPRGGTVFRGAPATEFESMTGERKRREQERQRSRAGVVS